MTFTTAEYLAVTNGPDTPEHRRNDADLLERAICRFLRAQLMSGGWHPEDDPAEQRGGLTGDRMCSDDAAELVTIDVRRIYAAGLDACALLLAAFPPHLPMTKWSEDA